MQLHLSFSGSINLPIAYRSIQQGMIYRALSEADSDYSRYIHDEGQIYQKKYKLFTFGPLKGRYMIEGKNIIFTDGASMEIRSVDEKFISLLAQSMPVGALIKLGQNDVQVIRSEVTDHHLLVPRASVRLVAPMTVHITLDDGYTRFFEPDEPEYLQAVLRNAKRKWASLHRTEEGFELSIEPLPGKKRMEKTLFRQTYITAFYGDYLLFGSPNVIDLLYESGLGAKSSQGFGMFDVK